MPVIKVWCLPSGQMEDDLNRLHQAIVKAVTSVNELGLKDQNDMTCLFPPDLMKYGLGEEIIVEIGGLFQKPERIQKVRQQLAENVGKAVSGLYPNAKTECFVATVDPSDGFWTSAESTQAEEELKEVITIDGRTFKVNVSAEACGRFGFHPDERVIANNGTKGSVVGVAPMPEESGCVAEGEDILWIAPDDRDGKVCFFPDPVNNLNPE